MGVTKYYQYAGPLLYVISLSIHTESPQKANEKAVLNQTIMFNKAAILAFLATQGVLAGVTKVPIFQAPKEQFLSNLLSTHTPPRLIKPSSNKASSTQRKLLRKEEQDTNYSPGENIVVRDLRNAQYYGEVHIGSKATK